MPAASAIARKKGVKRKQRVLKDLQFLSPTVFKYKGTYFQVLGKVRSSDLVKK